MNKKKHHDMFVNVGSRYGSAGVRGLYAHHNSQSGAAAVKTTAPSINLQRNGFDQRYG